MKDFFGTAVPSASPWASRALMSGTPPAAASVVNRSSCDWMPFSSVPGFTWPGQRSSIGTRTPPSQVVIFSLRKGVVAAVRPACECSGPLSVE